MAMFVAYDKSVKVNGQTILSVTNAMDYGKDIIQAILNKHELQDVQYEGWYNQQNWLNSFKEIYDTIGEKTLFVIGKAIPMNAKFPTDIHNVKEALAAIDIAYHMNHTKGEIGHYWLSEFSEEKRQAIMVCNNPYPSEFDRGIIMSMLVKYKPRNSIHYNVVRDPLKETRLTGAESCTYIVTW